MLTDEQMEKAKKALLDHKMRELAKRCLLRMYREEQARAERWQLPFRMVHKHEYLPGEIKPNDYYPHPSGVLKDADGTLSSVPESERITPDTARYYFTRILALNIDQLRMYKNSDWTGEAVSAATAQEIKAEYFRRIADYGSHPERYDTAPHVLTDDIKDRYMLMPALDQQEKDNVAI